MLQCQQRRFLKTLICSPLMLFSSSKTDEQDKRSLGTTVDCKQFKGLCDPNAACTADPREENRYICVCNNGFKGNGSVCEGMRVFLRPSSDVVLLFRAELNSGIKFDKSTAEARRLN